MLEIIPFKQSDGSRCGPAVIKMILYYYGIDALEDEICKRCNHTYELGCDDLGMKQAFESYDLAVKIYNNSTLADLEYWIKHRVPVVVDWFSTASSEETPNGHSSVVVNIDENNVYLMDPEIGKVRSISRDDFLRVWFDWKITSPYLTSLDDMILRQMIIVYPKRLENAN